MAIVSIRAAALAASLALATGAALAQDITGTFKGTEKVRVSRCGNFDGITTGPWEVTHAPLEGAAYSIKGSTAKSTFNGTGRFEGNGSTTSVDGIDQQGSRWTAKGKSTLDGDKLVATSSGEVIGTTCIFAAEIEAMRVR